MKLRVSIKTTEPILWMFLTSDGASVGWNRGYLLSHLSDYYKPKLTGDLRELISDLSNDFQVITDAIARYIFSDNNDSFLISLFFGSFYLQGLSFSDAGECASWNSRLLC